MSTNGGAQVRWRRDGKELFYIGLDGRLMAWRRSDLGSNRRRRAGHIARLAVRHANPRRCSFQGASNSNAWFLPDGQRRPESTAFGSRSHRASPIALILN